MPADTVEIREGDEEGVERLNGWGPIEIERGDDGRPRALLLRRCIRVYDEARRFAPVFEDAVRQRLECDTVLLAAGQMPDLEFLEDGGQDIEQARRGWPRVDPDTLTTSAARVFVAGDLAHGTRLLIDAVASGKRAARSIYTQVTGRALAVDALEAHLSLPGYRREVGYERRRRVEVPVREAAERLAQPRAEVEIGYDAEAAQREASRCLDCGVTPVFDGTRCVLCGGCVDVCPTTCLKIVTLADLFPQPDLDTVIAGALGAGADIHENSAILKDEDRCIRCALCAQRCPADAIAMERVQFQCEWRTA
jgi:ferredoxin